jgi:hypothetical protein
MGARLRRLSEVDRKVPRPFAGEFSGGLHEPSWLRRVSFTAQASLPAKGSRAGLTGWYSGREKEPR